MKSPVIIISSSSVAEDEAAIINGLFEYGIHRYHIHKTNATEQTIAEILEGVTPKYAGQISLHSHFHLVLAYGVGGIHYNRELENQLGNDFVEKAKLYQGFGIKVSGEKNTNTENDTLDYYITPESKAIQQTEEFQVIRIDTLENKTLSGIIDVIASHQKHQ